MPDWKPYLQSTLSDTKFTQWKDLYYTPTDVEVQPIADTQFDLPVLAFKSHEHEKFPLNTKNIASVGDTNKSPLEKVRVFLKELGDNHPKSLVDIGTHISSFTILEL